MSRKARPEEDSLERTLPHNLEAERSVLGTVIITNGSRFIEVCDELQPEDFFRDAHRRVFRAMINLHDQHIAIDLITLKDRLALTGELDEVGGPAYIARLIDGGLHSSNLEHYAAIIRREAVRRESIRIGHQLIADAHEGDLEPTEILDRAEGELIAASTRQGLAGGLESMAVVMQGMFEHVTALSEGRAVPPGLPTGFYALDDYVSLKPGTLNIVAARTSQGKSAFALDVALYTAMMTEEPVAYFSLEMDRDELRDRAVVGYAGVDGHLFQRGGLSDWHLRRVGDAIGILSETTLHLDTQPRRSLREIRVESRRLKARHGALALVVVDYLQLMKPPARTSARDRREIVGEFSRGLKELAKELHAPVMALSQLNREPDSRPDGRPQISDLRESGDLEQDADLVLLLHRPGLYNREKFPRDLAMVQIAKQRNGRIGTVKLRFIEESFKFGEWQEDKPHVSGDLFTEAQ